MRPLLLALLLGLLAAARGAVLDGREPAAVFQAFEELAAIPRPSGHLDGVRAHLLAFAAAHNLSSTVDGVGNVIIKRPGSGGGQDAPPVLLQAHMDMVPAAAPGSTHNFTTDPISLILGADGWLRANGTTLGADDGIGVALIQAVLQLPPEQPLPPIEALFTADEETTFSGAEGVDAAELSARTLINLDSEHWGEITVGSAGDTFSAINLDAEAQPVPADSVPVAIDVGGLLGGHSGQKINLGRANALKLASAAASAVLHNVTGACLGPVSGGTAINAIPNEARAVVVVPRDAVPAVQAIAAQAQADALLGFGEGEPDLFIRAAPLQVPVTAAPDANWGSGQWCLSAKGAKDLLGMLLTLPSGVLQPSLTIPGLPETSSNLGQVTPAWSSAAPGTANFTILVGPRSMNTPALRGMQDELDRLAEAFGGRRENLNENADGIIAAWTPMPHSPLANLTAEVMSEVAGQPAKLVSVHAGLEAGSIVARLPGATAVSIGPNVRDVHTPQERLEVGSVAPLYETLLLVLERLAQE